MFKKILLFLGIFIAVFLLASTILVASAIIGKAPSCPEGPGKVRAEKDLLYLVETKGLTLSDSEATALIQKPLSEKIADPRICFTKNLLHLSGKIKAGKIMPSFYITAGLDLTQATPKTKDLDIRIGSVPNLFIFSPVEKMLEGIINGNLSKMEAREKYAVEFDEGKATIRRVR